MTIDWTIEPLSALAGHGATWDELNTRAGALPFLESSFMLPLARHFARGEEQLAIGRQHGRAVAAGIVAPVGVARWATWQPSQLPLGPWLVAGGVEADAAAATLLRRLPGWVLELGLTQLDPLFTARGDDDAGPSQTLDYIPTAWVDVQGSFHAYWEARGKNLRTNMRKQRAKLANDGIRLEFTEIVEPNAVPAALAEYGALEAASWKGAEGSAVRPDNAQGRFYADMMTAYCRLGRGRIWRLTFDGKPVAIDLSIDSGTTLVVLKTAFDPTYRAVSPAFLLKQDAFTKVFEAGRVRRIEFYGRRMEWHTRWTEASRTLYHANHYRWAWLPVLRGLVQRKAAPPVSPDVQAPVNG